MFVSKVCLSHCFIFEFIILKFKSDDIEEAGILSAWKKYCNTNYKEIKDKLLNQYKNKTIFVM